MSKVMFITVGTSLFESVTWEPRGQLPQSVPYYESHWLRDQKKLRSPEARCGGARDRKVRSGLEAALDGINGADWAAHLPEDLLRGEPNPTTFLRYSAELTTVLKLYDLEAEGGGSLGEWLKTYDAIRLAYDEVGPKDFSKNLQAIAAAHLAQYLNKIVGQERVALTEPFPGLSSTNAERVLGPGSGLDLVRQRLERELKEPQDVEIDLVVSGGYKLYALVLGRMVRQEGRPEKPPVRNVRAHYFYEEGSELVTFEANEVISGNTRVSDRPKLGPVGGPA
jgi:hypothetical protein